MSEEKRDRSRSWPAWLAPLRPDDVARARMRSAIVERAGPWLRRRRAPSVWELAEEAALRLAPLAASALILFGWMAHRVEPEPLSAPSPADAPSQSDAPSHVAVEELLRSSGAGARAGPPAVLTSASAPSQDLVLAATLRGDD